MLKPKNLKVFAMILLTSALLIVAINANVSSVKAATTESMLVYSSLGGTISVSGTTLTGGSSYSYTTGSTVTFTANPSSGFKFLCFETATASGSITSTTNPYPYTVSAAGAIMAMFTPTTNVTQPTTGSGSASVDMFIAIGGTTVPKGQTAAITGYTQGTTESFTQTPGTGFKFLYWMVDTSAGATVYTESPLSIKLAYSSTAIQAFWIPTSSTVTLPTIISEFSSAMVAVILSVLVLIAAGTYVYTRRAKK